jgi:hypothetical protein
MAGNRESVCGGGSNTNSDFTISGILDFRSYQKRKIMEIARFWRLKEAFRLIGMECQKCKKKIIPSRDICPNCGNNANTLEVKGVKIPLGIREEI